jgi:hypothetical protein
MKLTQALLPMINKPSRIAVRGLIVQSNHNYLTYPAIVSAGATGNGCMLLRSRHAPHTRLRQSAFHLSVMREQDSRRHCGVQRERQCVAATAKATAHAVGDFILPCGWLRFGFCQDRPGR